MVFMFYICAYENIPFQTSMKMKIMKITMKFDVSKRKKNEKKSLYEKEKKNCCVKKIKIVIYA